ncbi:2-hydroxychromene-2-carboxylate isomerase [Sandaracinobacteroides saxicola]|uniref:2-hydroxychromene-2-carboxylate isomerase n=1 Tax=Sandaracinobacteroides saxicola TaxID=2759707 RepID=A0A7G5II36_9SPHN|nr:DsbA family protein [Sandaracinobacteroides saxicola]QMW23028.1 DsbA family protein [Sandaracinobacteroides saxicola]
MTLTIDLFWSFRSPYSYLATPRLLALRAEWDLAIRFRPVRPLAVRDAGFFERIDPRWPLYVVRDVFRLAQMAGLPFAPPRPDPIVQNMATREIAAEQPHIGRLTRLGQAAAEQGDGLAFAHAVASRIWGGTPDWHQGTHLAEAAAVAGLDWAALDIAEREETARLDAAIAANEAAQDASGHWGVPLMLFDGEPFFGQDRIDVLLWRLRQNGLVARE